VFALQDTTTDSAKAFLEFAAVTEDAVFAITSVDAVFSEYKVTKDSVVLFKKVRYVIIVSFIFSTSVCRMEFIYLMITELQQTSLSYI